MTAAQHTWCERHVDGDPTCVMQDPALHRSRLWQQAARDPQPSRLMSLLAGLGIFVAAAVGALGLWVGFVALLSLAVPR